MFKKLVEKVKLKIARILLHLSLGMLFNIFKFVGLSGIRNYYMLEFNRLVKVIFNMLQNGTVKIKQLTICGNNQYFKGEMTIPNDECLFDIMFYYGANEKEIQHFIHSKANKDMDYCVLDIGASIGTFTNQLHSKFNNFRYVCVEPDKKPFSYLKMNTREIKDVFLFNLALSDYNGPGDYFYDNKNIGNRGLIRSAIKELGKGDVELAGKVEVRDAKEFIKDNFKLFFDRQIILKIDTQGSDLLIFQRIFDELSKNLAIVIIELTPSCISRSDAETVINMLKQFDVYYYKHNQNYYIQDFEKVEISQLKHDLLNLKHSFSIYVAKVDG